MTDSPVTKTAEQVAADAMNELWPGSAFDGSKWSADSHEAATIAAAFCNAGLLVSGAPSEEQIEAAINTYVRTLETKSAFQLTVIENWNEHVAAMRAALAGVGSPVPVQVDEDVVDTIEDLQNLGYGSIIQEGDEAPKILRYSEFEERWWENPMHRASAVGDKWISLPARVLYQRGGAQ